MKMVDCCLCLISPVAIVGLYYLRIAGLKNFGCSLNFNRFLKKMMK